MDGSAACGVSEATSTNFEKSLARDTAKSLLAMPPVDTASSTTAVAAAAAAATLRDRLTRAWHGTGPVSWVSLGSDGALAHAPGKAGFS